MPIKPHSPSCDRNQAPIMDKLKLYINPGNRILEIGSGTGQHGVYFARNFPESIWQCTDHAENLLGINTWIHDAKLNNLAEAFELDINTYDWPDKNYSIVFSANTLHIMSWTTALRLFNHVKNTLTENGLLIFYGPFTYHGEYTSQSNADFDQWLKNRDPESGIREIADISEVLNAHGFEILNDHPMPANNQLLVYRKTK